MIIIRILNNRVTKVIKGDADVIVQNSLRANDVFFIFENATDGKTAEVYFERRKADNSIETIGGFVATPTTKTLRMAIDDGQAAQERLWSGFYYKFNTKEITRVATDNLTIGLKVYDYDENDERREIASVSTILQVVPSAITPSPILSITDAQLEALYTAINALNQPIVDLSRVFEYDTSVSSQYVASYIFDNTTDTEGIYNVGGRLFVKSVGYIVATPNTYDKGGVYGYNEVEGVKVAYLISDGEVKIGILNNLLTNDKTSLVMAINEVIQSTFKLVGNNTITGYNQYNQKQWFNDGMEVNGDASFSEGDVDFNGNVSFNKRVTTPKDVIVNDSEGHAGKSTFTSFARALKTEIGNATQEKDGLMSKEDKARLDELVELLGDIDGDSDTFVNTIREVLAIFNNYPEGTTFAQALATKVDNETFYDEVERLDNRIDSLDASSQEERISELERKDVLQDAKIDAKVDKADSQTNTVYANINNQTQNITMTSGASAGTIAYRDSNGCVGVGTPTTDSHATTKKYVDDNFIAKSNAALEDVDQVFVKYANGTYGSVRFSSNVNPSTIAQRGASSEVYGNTFDYHNDYAFVNKGYANAHYSPKVTNPENYSLYAFDSSGSNGVKSIIYTTGATKGTIPVRDASSNNFEIGTPVNDNHVVNKKYADEHFVPISASGGAENLNQCYVRRSNGAVELYTFTPYAADYSIMQRDSAGCSYVETPSNPADTAIANVGYVKNALGLKLYEHNVRLSSGTGDIYMKLVRRKSTALTLDEIFPSAYKTQMATGYLYSSGNIVFVDSISKNANGNYDVGINEDSIELSDLTVDSDDIIEI